MFVNVVKLCNLLSEKTVLITGSNQGIGYQTALALAGRNFKIIMADKADLTNSKCKIIEITKNTKILTKFTDFTRLSSVRSLAGDLIKTEQKLDVLINNVGVFCLGKERTIDGLQATMQVNHFGPFLLTYLLSDLLIKSSPSRVIFVSSIGAFFHRLTLDNLNNPDVAPIEALSSLLVYYNSKLCNIIIANGFAEKLKNCGVTSNSVHPGMTATSFLWKGGSCPTFFKLLTQDPDMGAQANIYLATSDNVSSVTGKYFVDLKEHQQPRITKDLKFCRSIWTESEYFVGLTQNECSIKFN